jgi:hypothetical protein
MFAINHAATALIIKKRYTHVPLLWLLLSVQFVEILWVLFNYLGIEMTTTEPVIDTVRDIHLAYMPYSHSLASSLVLALIAWVLIKKVSGSAVAANAVAIAVISHIVLDVVTHARDIAIIPFLSAEKVGLGLYTVPTVAFFVEMAYGLFCWRLFRGSKPLLVTIVAFNVANASFFFVTLKGPEVLMAGHPLWIVSAVAMQIVITLALVGILAKPRALALERQSV